MSEYLLTAPQPWLYFLFMSKSFSLSLSPLSFHLNITLNIPTRHKRLGQEKGVIERERVVIWALNNKIFVRRWLYTPTSERCTPPKERTCCTCTSLFNFFCPILFHLFSTLPIAHTHTHLDEHQKISLVTTTPLFSLKEREKEKHTHMIPLQRKILFVAFISFYFTFFFFCYTNYFSAV